MTQMGAGVLGVYRSHVLRMSAFPVEAASRHRRSGRSKQAPHYFPIVLRGGPQAHPTSGVRVGTRCDASTGGPRNADGEGRNADAIGIYPVHGVWTVVDGGTVAHASP